VLYPYEMTEQLSASARRCPVLVVDDDAPHREALAAYLIDAGHEVRLAAHGAEAWEIVAQMEPPPCLIVLDLRMPVMNGFEFLSRLRALRGRTGRLPVCVLTGETVTDELPTPYVLSKPVELPRLMAIVDRHCPGAQTASRPATASLQENLARLERLLRAAPAAQGRQARDQSRARVTSNAIRRLSP
jgi:two-component system, OmpR family, response regulator CpxR